MFLDLIENDMYTNLNPINYHVLIVACLAGYFGPKCLPCHYPYYGVGCQFECVCDMKNCSHITGCQSSSNAEYICVRN